MFFPVERCANDSDVLQAGDNVPSDDSYHKQGEQISAQVGHDAASNCWRLCTGTKLSVLVLIFFHFFLIACFSLSMRLVPNQCSGFSCTALAFWGLGDD